MRFGIAVLATLVVGGAVILLLSPQPVSRARSGATRPADPESIEKKRAAASEAANASAGPRVALAEASRRAIFAAAIGAQARAAADVRAPGDASSDPLGPGFVAGPERRAKQEIKRKGQVQALEDEYLGEVAARHGISQPQILEILAEGRANQWAAPKP